MLADHHSMLLTRAGHLDAVDQATLKEAQRISRFAVASYGLQSVIWAQGK
jgi:hypothetical protein